MLGFVAVWKERAYLGLLSLLLNMVAGIFNHILSELNFPVVLRLIPNINIVFYVFLLLFVLSLVAIAIWMAM
jgi:hypothetical protein